MSLDNCSNSDGNTRNFRGETIYFQHLLREVNKLADHLSNIAIDGEEVAYSQVLIALRLMGGESSTMTNYYART